MIQSTGTAEWETPVLTVLGDLETLTGTGGVNNSDGGGLFSGIL